MTATIQDLRNVYRSLDPAGQEKARSLGDWFNRKGFWTEAQQRLVSSLVTRTRLPTAQLDLTGLNALFDIASRNLQRPFIVAQVDNQMVKISRASATSRNPGAVYVKAKGGDYLGKIAADGRWMPVAEAAAFPNLAKLLADLADDPAGVARAQGQAFGHCCFCAKMLTDARSVKMGYGPVCADNFGLPWGEK